MLHIDHLSKFYGKETGSFDISSRWSPAISAPLSVPTAPGKTTTIKSALGLIPFDSGTITIDGHNIRNRSHGGETSTVMSPIIRSSTLLCGASTI